MSFGELERLRVYMVTYMVASLLLTLLILPGLVTSLTPFRYKELVGPIRAALITAFATGNIFIVLPVLAERSKSLVKKLEYGSGGIRFHCGCRDFNVLQLPKPSGRF